MRTQVRVKDGIDPDSEILPRLSAERDRSDHQARFGQYRTAPLAILSDLQNVKAQPGLDIIKLLPKEDLAIALRPAVERIGSRNARELDYELVDRYGGSSGLGIVQAAFEEDLGKWACAPQSAMLRYFLRVDPEYGAKEASASLSARKNTRC